MNNSHVPMKSTHVVEGTRRWNAIQATKRIARKQRKQQATSMQRVVTK